MYHEVAKFVLAEKEKVTISYGTKFLEQARASAPPEAASSHYSRSAEWSNPNYRRFLRATQQRAGKSNYRIVFQDFNRFWAWKSIRSSRRRTILRNFIRSLRDTVDEDGLFPTKSFVKATIHPLFLPVLTANKNSKATKAMQEAANSMAAE